jgi:hypothetical protein
MQREIVIQCPDGQIKTVPLQGNRFTVGRSSTAELCFPDDAGLSRQHMVLERDGDDWTVQDLGSKKWHAGQQHPLARQTAAEARRPYHRGDIWRLSSTIRGGRRAARGRRGDLRIRRTRSAPVLRPSSPAWKARSPTRRLWTGPASPGAKQVQALIRAGQELAGRGTLADLFPLILDLAIEGVGSAARRGHDPGRRAPRSEGQQGRRFPHKFGSARSGN